jgi:hypothetical protein
LGGGWDWTEQGIAKLPIIGSSIKAARGRAVEDFNRATINDALSHIDESVPKDLKGNAAVAHAYDKLGERYDALLTKMKGSLDEPAPPQNALTVPGQAVTPPTPSLRMELDNIKAMAASSKMPKPFVDEINRIIDTEIIDRFQKGGVTSGETIKEIQSQLRELSQTKGRSENYDVRRQGAAIQEAKAALDRMIERENPEYAAELKAVNEGYAKFKIVQRAAASTGAKEGVFTPAQFQSAVRAKDVTKDKRAYSEGEALQQPFAQAGKKILGNTLPDSGTPTQLLIADLLLGGGGHMLLGPQGIAAGLALPAIYSRPGMTAMQRLLMNPPSGARAGARAGVVGTAQDEARKRFIAEMLKGNR